MNLVITILLAALIFGVIIFIHELGHFLTAKSVGISVHEFALGMGPAIWQTTRGGTQYTLRLLPIGGFVSMEGEDEDSSDDGAFCNKKVWQRILVVCAGAAMNILLGLGLMVGIAAMQPYTSTTTLTQFDPQATSSQVLQVGDEIRSVNGISVHIANDMIYAFASCGSDPIDLEIERDGQRMLLADVPFVREEIEGMSMVQLDFKILATEKTIPNMLREAWYMTTGVVKQVWISFGKLITGQFEMNQLSGPVGVTQAIGQVAATRDYSNVLMLAAFITINIGVFNLLPLPALDGGRLVFLLLEGLRGKPVPARYEGYVHAAGLMLLLGLMLVVTFNDLARLLLG